MQVTVKFFGADRQTAGADQVRVELSAGTSIAGMAQLLQQKYGDMSFDPERTTFLINQSPATRETILNEGDTVYVFHPLGGG